MMDLDTITLEAAKLAKVQGFNAPTKKYFLVTPDGEVDVITSDDAINRNSGDSNEDSSKSITYSAPTQLELNKWRTNNHLNDLRDDQREYPVPQKDGITTEYPDGIILTGGWGSRIAEWLKFNLHRIPQGH